MNHVLMILPGCTIRNVRRTVNRKCILILEIKGLIPQFLVIFFRKKPDQVTVLSNFYANNILRVFLFLRRGGNFLGIRIGYLHNPPRITGKLVGNKSVSPYRHDCLLQYLIFTPKLTTLRFLVYIEKQMRLTRILYTQKKLKPFYQRTEHDT